MHLFISAIITSILVLFATSAHAERAGKILYYNASKSAPKEAFIYINDKAFAKHELPRWHFSPAMKIKAGEIVMTFTPKAIVAGDKIPKEAPKVKIPKNWRKFLLLVLPDPKNEYFPIKVKAIDASSNAYKEGDIYFINFSKATVFGHIGEKKLVLRAGRKKIISSNSSGGSGDCVAQLDFFIGDKTKTHRFIRQTWNHSSKTRRMIFILPKKNGGLSYYATPIRDL